MPCLANLRPGKAPGQRCSSRCAPTPRGRRSSPTSTAPWRRSPSGPSRRRCRRRRGRLLAALSERFGLVGCVSGRRAEEARRLVGLDGIAYAGNHGLELLLPGDEEPRLDPSLAGRESEAADFIAGLGDGALVAAGLRPEDKGPIQALHWRGAEDERARRGARPRDRRRGRGGPGSNRAGAARCWSCARSAAAARTPRSPRCSPPTGSTAAVYAGDDRTDLDAFRRLRELRESGRAGDAVCVGIVSPEAPAELAEESDLTRRRAGRVAGDPRVAGGVTVPYTDLLRVTVFLTGAEATALGAITALGANRHGDTTTLVIATAWWLISLAIGLYLGRRARAADGVRDALARARTATSLPQESGRPDRPRPPLADRRDGDRRRRASASSSPAWRWSAPATP